MPVLSHAEGAWHLHPPQQQRGAQLQNGGAPKEAVAGRGAQKHDEADQQVAGEPARGIDYPASNPEDRAGDITPTLPEDGEPQRWDDVVQPEGHARQAPDREQQARTDAAPDAHEQPLPEGK